MSKDRRRSYQIQPIIVNARRIDRIVIDSHYEKRHGDSINDPLIVELVKLLNGQDVAPEQIVTPYEYFASLLVYFEKQYRLVWLLEDSDNYIGVLNAYRDSRTGV